MIDTTKPGIGLRSDPHREDAPGMVGHPEHTVTGMVGDRTTDEEVRTILHDRGYRG